MTSPHRLEFVGSDLVALVYVLAEAVKITRNSGTRPEITVNGKPYRNCDLTKVASLVPREEIPDGESVPGATRRSRTYCAAAFNLAHSANSIESNRRFVDFLEYRGLQLRSAVPSIGEPRR